MEDERKPGGLFRLGIWSLVGFMLMALNVYAYSSRKIIIANMIIEMLPPVRPVLCSFCSSAR